MSSSNLREISNDQIKQQLLAGSFTTPAKRRHLPMAYNLFRQDQLAIKNILSKRSASGKPDAYQRAVEAIRRKWDNSPELQAKYDKIRHIIDEEIKSLRSWELGMIRFGEKHPESMVINDASWHWQQDQYKFVHARVRARNSLYQFVKGLKRFGSNKSIQKEKFNEVYSEWKASDHSLKLLQWPTVGGRIVDLFELYRIIVMQGGLGRSLKKATIWQELGAQMRLCGTRDTLFYQLRIIYYKYLLSFEHKYQVSKERGDHNKLKLKKTWIRPKEEDNVSYCCDFEYVADDGNDHNNAAYVPYADGMDSDTKRNKTKKRKRYKTKHAQDDLTSIPFHTVHKELADYSSDDIYDGHFHKKRKIERVEHNSHFIHDAKRHNVSNIDTHNVFGKDSDKYVKKGARGISRHFNSYWNGMHFIAAIILSLKSRIASNVNWALNRLLFLSFNTKSNIAEPFVIKHHAKQLLDALLNLMPHIDIKQFDTINKDAYNSLHGAQSLLSLDLSSNCFGHNKRININGLKAIRNDSNCLLDPSTTRVILRVLSNLALTADNQQCMVDHPLLLPYILALVKRKDVIPSDCYFNHKKNECSEIHVDALRVIAHLSEKITLTKWTKHHIKSKQSTRYKNKVPFSDKLVFEGDNYKMNSIRFLHRLMEIVSMNLSISSVIDTGEYKHWMLYYSLMICCHLAANPNNHGVLNQYIKYKIDAESNHNNSDDIQYVDLSNVLSFNNTAIDVSNLMIFRPKESVLQNECEWILRITNHILSPNTQIKLSAIEAAIYLFESNISFTQYLFHNKAVLKEAIDHLVDIGSNDFYGHQLYRSASYLLSLLYKQCGNQSNHIHLFSNCNSRIFEACAQYDDFACYAIYLAQLKQQNTAN